MFGFKNDGNTCWFNSAIHAILHIPQIANLLRDDHFEGALIKKRKNASDFSLELARLAASYWSTVAEGGVETIGELRDIFCRANRQYAGRRQHDAGECFMSITSTLETALKKPRAPVVVSADEVNMEELQKYYDSTSSSFITDVFVSQIENTTESGTVSYEHVHSLVLFPSKTLAHGITNYMTDCQGVKKRFTKFPVILTVLLMKSPEKEFVYYDIDMNIDGVAYTLIAVLSHGNNHWVATCKTCRDSGAWHMYDDDRVERIYDMNSIVHRDAMMLVYSRTNV